MPTYVYEHPKTKKTIELIQTMNEPHEYTDDKGVAWTRVFTVPRAIIDNSMDPYNEAQFEQKLANTQGTVGDAFDRSREMSEKRASKNGGVDPVKQQYYEDYAKRRKGKQHPDLCPETLTL